MKKPYLTALLVLGCGYASVAQNAGYKTSIQTNLSLIGLGNTRNAQTGVMELPLAAGLSLTHKVVKNLSAQLAYQRWLGDLSPLAKVFTGSGVVTRERYQFIDINAIYNLHTRQHTLYAGIGASYAWGQDLISVRVDTTVDGVGYHSYRNATQYSHRFGGNALVGYDYSLLHGRMSVGAQFKLHALAKGFVQYGGGINVGVHLKK